MQFYRCFLILFHCKHSSLENGQSSMPSRTTGIQLKRRAYSNPVASNAPPSIGLQNDCSTPVSDWTNPHKITPWYSSPILNLHTVPNDAKTEIIRVVLLSAYKSKAENQNCSKVISIVVFVMTNCCLTQHIPFSVSICKGLVNINVTKSEKGANSHWRLVKMDV